MKPLLNVHIFANTKKKEKNRFTTAERVTIEDGVTTIRPIRNGVPGGTEKELEVAFEDFKRAIDSMWQPDPRMKG